MTMDNEKTLVVFRRWRDTNDIIALFPAEPSDIEGWYCLSYERVGQHAGADYHGVVQASGPATDEEVAPLAEELTLIGYNLQPIRRASQTVHERRRATARAIRTSSV
jgi:hypothetical protein